MKILHYALGFPPYRTGGLTKYCTDLMLTQAEQGHEVALLWPGQISMIKKQTEIHKEKSWNGIESFEIINPLPVSLDEGILDVEAYTKKTDEAVYLEFLQDYAPDAIHIHTLMGLHKEFIHATNELGIRTVFTTHDYFGLCPKVFLANLYNKTRTVIKFEETDYYALLKRVKKNAVVLKETDLEIVQRACELISKKYNNSTVEFGFYHGDFTPWNTVIENGKIKVFDFEYAKRTYPPYLDAVHYLLQKNFFVDGLNDANQIYSSLKESSIWKKFDDRRSLEMVIMYLLEIINLYLSRTSEESLDEKSRQKIRIEILEKAVTEYANLSR